jgi:hypothetical protein
MKIRYTIRDLLWLTLVVGLCLAWFAEHRIHQRTDMHRRTCKRRMEWIKSVVQRNNIRIPGGCGCCPEYFPECFATDNSIVESQQTTNDCAANDDLVSWHVWVDLLRPLVDAAGHALGVGKTVLAEPAGDAHAAAAVVAVDDDRLVAVHF